MRNQLGGGVPEKKPFADSTWEEIAKVSELGLAKEYYKIGDIKPLELTGIGTVNMQIVDFDHDLLEGKTEAKKAGISLISEKFLPTTYAMNPNADGGFPASELYNNVLSKTVFNAIPSKLRSKIKTIYKWYNTGNFNEQGDWFGTKVWLPLACELFISPDNDFNAEEVAGRGKIYEFFKKSNNRVKNQARVSEYWTASRSGGGGKSFVTVYTNSGAETNNNPTIKQGVLVCFSL